MLMAMRLAASVSCVWDQFLLSIQWWQGQIRLDASCSLDGLSLYQHSMAEMASMASTPGEQYHWVSEFALPQF